MPTSAPRCVFCAIIDGKEPASVVFHDDRCLAFMGIQPSAPGECMVIPRAHVDRFTDLDEDLAAHLMAVAHRIGRRVRNAFPCERIGFVVHGFGVAHAHLLIVPQAGPHHITSDRFARAEAGGVVFDAAGVGFPPREVLDRHAALLRRAVGSS